MSYQLVAADLERDREAVLGVWCRNISWCTAAEHEARLRWLMNNPCGPTRMFMTRHQPGGEVVGVIGLILRHISVAGKRRLAGIVADVAVDEGHRTVQPAMLLARAVAGCLGEEIPLIWTHPNHASAGVLRRAGLRDEGQCVSYYKILHSLSRLQRRGIPAPLDRYLAGIVDVALRLQTSELRRSSYQCVRANSPALAALLSAAEVASIVNVQRTPEFLEWVYEQSPYRDYALLGSGDGTEQQLDGFACCYEKHGFAEIDDIVYRPQGNAWQQVIDAAVAWARQKACSDISIRLTNPNAGIVRALRRNGFRSQPWRPLLVLRHPSLPPGFRLFDNQESVQTA